MPDFCCGRRRKATGLLRRFFDWFNRVFERATHGYVSLSGALVRRSVLALVALLVFGAAGLFFGSRVPSSFLPDEDQGYVYVNMQLAECGFARTNGRGVETG